MAIDTPAKLAILGAGPIGLEAALYARFLGYEVVIFERGEVAQSVRQWGHVRMFTPFGLNRSPLGLAALQAQDETYRPPGDQELLTGREWVEQYLLPLAHTDLLADHLQLNTEVVAIGKEELLKGDMPEDEDRGDWSFRVLSRDKQGEEKIDLFDGVLDCTGVFPHANWLGHGGIPAIGETSLAIEYRLPDILGTDRGRYAGKHTLVVGAGMSAATNIVALAELAKSEPGTRVTWITRREGPVGAGGPIAVVENDPLSAREQLSRQANALAGDPASAVTYWPGNVVERMDCGSAHAGPFQVHLSGARAGIHACDQIIANVGFRPDYRMCEELQLHESSTLRTLEPNFYVLGSKSYGRKSNFLFSVGLEQIREVFTIIGDRPTLDLYASAKGMLR